MDNRLLSYFWEWDEELQTYRLDDPEWRAQVVAGKPECFVTISIWATETHGGRRFTIGIEGLENAQLFAQRIGPRLLLEQHVTR